MNANSHRPARPAAPLFENIPSELKSLRRWLVWSYGEKPNSLGKYGKIPYNIADRQANFTNPETWLPFDIVFKQYSRQEYDGIGIVLGDGLCGLDEDHCWREDWWCEEASLHIEHLRSYSEYSVSGDGVHVLAFGSLPAGPRKVGDHELYDANRFLVVTGNIMDGGAPRNVEHREKELHEVHAMICGAGVLQTAPPLPSESVTQVQINRHCLLPGTVTQVHASNTQRLSLGSVTQVEAITQRGGGESNTDLSGYLEEATASICLPDSRVLAMLLKNPTIRGYWDGYPVGANESAIDWAVAVKLAFYTGKNYPQMERLFRRSALYCRSKHSSRRGDETYLTRTLRRACEFQSVVWCPRKGPSTPKRPMGAPKSKNTRDVLALLSEKPDMLSVEIASILGLKSALVRKIRQRHLPNPLRCLGESA